jgi:arylsulfatase A-like enzyme
MRACNYPYRGYKNTLYEGGTLSPAFLYSTKQKFPRKRVNSIFHIIDWFPTILNFAGFKKTEFLEIDGVNQMFALKHKYYKNPRKNFIYGVLNEFKTETKGIYHIVVTKQFNFCSYFLQIK